MTEFTGEVHPFADRFPMLTDEELADLADDIKANGQLHPILLSPEGVLLDGRNRLAACERAGVVPKFETYEGNPVALIVSANVRRRQMTPGQAAMAAAIGLNEDGKRSGGRWGKGVAKLVKTNEFGESALNRCGVILDYDAERGTTFADSVLTGLPLNEAYKNVMTARRAEQEATDAAERERVATQERDAAARVAFDELRAGAPDLAELVRADKLTLDDARAAWDNRRREELQARDLLISEWSRACDGLLTALAWANDYQTPPADLPGSRTQPADFVERLHALIEITKEWE